MRTVLKYFPLCLLCFLAIGMCYFHGGGNIGEASQLRLAYSISPPIDEAIDHDQLQILVWARRNRPILF